MPLFRRRTRRFARLIGVCLLASAATGTTSCHRDRDDAIRRPTSPRPNIVFILADDLGWGDVGFHGSAYATPHIDSLAGEGLELTHHYVQPDCSPTRTELMTGRRASRRGLISATNKRVIADAEPTLASVLHDAGYFTAISGKWHLGSRPVGRPNLAGFDESYGALAGGAEPYTHGYHRYRLNWFRNGEPLREEGHATDLIAAQAVRWIEEAGDRPFFLYVPFTAVHTPLNEPDTYLDPYTGRFEDPERRLYAAAVSHLDAAIGRIVAALDESGHADDTVVVFTSDNGAVREEGNAPLRGGKSQPFEGGIRVPTIVRWPGKIAAGEMRAPVAILDWLPTLAPLAGATTPSGLDGEDIGPLLRGRGEAGDRTFYWRSTLGSAVRDGRWKYVDVPGARLLFDIEADPLETTDLSAARPSVRARLQGMLEAKEAAEPAPRASY